MRLTSIRNSRFRALAQAGSMAWSSLPWTQSSSASRLVNCSSASMRRSVFLGRFLRCQPPPVPPSQPRRTTVPSVLLPPSNERFAYDLACNPRCWIRKSDALNPGSGGSADRLAYPCSTGMYLTTCDPISVAQSFKMQLVPDQCPIRSL